MESAEPAPQTLQELIKAMGPIEVLEPPYRGPEHLSALLLMVDEVAPEYVAARRAHLEVCEVCTSMVNGLVASDAA